MIAKAKRRRTPRLLYWANERIEYIQKILVFVGIIGIGISGIFAAKGLYGDGAHHLLLILTDVTITDHPRKFALIITQFPILLSIKAGVTDLNILIRLHSFSLIAMQLLFWLAALTIVAKTKSFWSFVFCFCVTYLTSGFFPIGEYNIAYAVVAFCSAILLSATISIWMAVLLVASALMLTRSYEAMLFLGPLLYLAALWRLKKTEAKETVTVTACLVAAAFLFAVASAISFWSIMFPREPENLATASDLSDLFWRPKIIIIGVGCLFVFIGSVLKGKLIHQILILATVCIACFYIVKPDMWEWPGNYYNVRALSGILLYLVLAAHFLFASLLEIGVIRPVQFHATVYRNVAFIIFIAFCVPFYTLTFDYYFWLKKFEKNAREVVGYIPIDRSDIWEEGKNGNKFVWSWSNPSLSIVLRGDFNGGILNATTHRGYQPFDQNGMSKNPLERFKRTNLL